MNHALRGVLAGLALILAVPSSAEPALRQRENVLGTSFEMAVAGVPDDEVDRALAAALAEVARLDAVLSVWKDDSELARYNASTGAQAPSPDLRTVLRACERWREKTGHAFSCRLGSLLARWRKADGGETLPDRAELRTLARAIDRAAVDLAGDGPVPRPEGLQWETDALAKGWILDRALERARAAVPAATGIRIDIGGDAVYWGEPAAGTAWRVAVADPRQPRDNGGHIATLTLRSRAIAASGHGSRGAQIGRRHYSHVLDPKDGWPVAYAPSAIVVADDAATADALATALTVMPIRAGLDLVEGLPGVAALVVTETGTPFVSSGWAALLDGDSRSDPAWPAGFAFAVDYEIPQQAAAEYRRPYLAIWIAARDGTPVRQLLVLGDSARWLRELPTWWRRYGRRDESAIHGIARETRRPGRYSVGWDGRDDRGRAAAAGDYVLVVEAAREHGGHELVELPFTLSARPIALERSGAAEVGRIQLRLGAAR
ncbi:DUF2271 domain-containing protein [Dokdonella koreensis]|uniref:FAD:protein FMN transferase n=1 Tax=Dokdonella koreensis DS-123 TaxID=1300342 RepID=A0A160DV43_9GAMM|nr:DUF2271 domain-containing protein [Dokdonella koreensis]ANB18385.1 Thiamine biosynthesis lipoprotein [Dokdonella koreensis DS-123]